MYNNYYFLRQLSRVLGDRLTGFTVVACFSQSRDELILEFNNAQMSFFLRASFQADFCCLSFPNKISRARKNSVDLFPSMIMTKVTGIRQYENERSFSISLDGDRHLLFNLHGNRSNVVLLHGTQVEGIFRNNLAADWEVQLATLDRTIDWSFDYFISHQDTLRKVYFTFGSEVWKYLNASGFDDVSIQGRWGLIQDTLRRLEVPRYSICSIDGRLIFTLLPVGTVINSFTDPVEAVSEFYHVFTQTAGLIREKSAALHRLRSQYKSSERYIRQGREKLDTVVRGTPYSIWADLIMANLNQIPPGVEKVTLENLYDNNHPIDIVLKKSLSALQNAEAYYRKGKNRQIEIQTLTESITTREKDLESLLATIDLVESETDLKALRQRIKDAGLEGDVAESQAKSLPYREEEFKGFRIFVGKNAAANDELTLKYSYKDDLWLHAKDVAGSHVLVKYQSGKNFPKDVIEHAAKLAAYHSKRKNESLCPVIVTPKKYVRKRKGDPPGAVIVERENVILVSTIG